MAQAESSASMSDFDAVELVRPQQGTNWMKNAQIWTATFFRLWQEEDAALFRGARQFHVPSYVQPL